MLCYVVGSCPAGAQEHCKVNACSARVVEKSPGRQATRDRQAVCIYIAPSGESVHTARTLGLQLCYAVHRGYAIILAVCGQQFRCLLFAVYQVRIVVG